MMLIFSAFAAGFVFGLGLVISQMVNPAKVIAFLDIFGAWDPSLAVVMAAAVSVSALGYLITRHRGRAVLTRELHTPARRDIDRALIGGAVLFGVGWGLAGLCPGPALAILPFALWKAFLFAAAIFGGMALFEVVRSWSSLRRQLQPADG